MQRSFKSRLEALEGLDRGLNRADALRRAPIALRAALLGAYALLDQDVPPEDWPDAEIEAYCAVECKHLAHVTDRQLEALINAAEF
jgi:hypothetical protein